MPELVVRRGGVGRTPITVGSSALIGRSRRADVCLPDRGVSARHALVRVTEAGAFVMDLASQNGTFLNQRRVETPVRLQAGDVMRLGDAVVEYLAGDPEPDSSATVQVPALPVRTDTQVFHAVPVPPAATPSATAVGIWPDAVQAALLDDLQRLLMKSLDPGTLLPAIARRLLTALPRAERVFVMRGDGQGPLRMAASCARSGPQEVVPSNTLLRRVVERREGLVYGDVRTEAPFGQADSLQVGMMRGVMCAPLVFDDHVYGVIQADTTLSIAAFSQTDLRWLMAVAGHIAATLAYVALHEQRLAADLQAHDLDWARKIQRQFLPEQPPELMGFGFAVDFEPALAVGGDFYDFMAVGRDQIAVAIGDVSGKGISAAIFAAAVLADWRSLAATSDDPGEVLRQLNARLTVRDHGGMFVTMAVLFLATATGELAVTTAGHPLPLVLEASGAVTPLGRIGSAPMGIDPDSAFETHRYVLDEGDTVLMYTDGISEAATHGGELFGDKRVQAALGVADGSAPGAITAISKAVGTFLDGLKRGDDATIVAVARAKGAQ